MPGQGGKRKSLEHPSRGARKDRRVSKNEGWEQEPTWGLSRQSWNTLNNNINNVAQGENPKHKGNTRASAGSMMGACRGATAHKPDRDYIPPVSCGRHLPKVTEGPHLCGILSRNPQPPSNHKNIIRQT